MPMDFVAPPNHPRWQYESRSDYIRGIEQREWDDYLRELDRRQAAAMYYARLRLAEYEHRQEKINGWIGILLIIFCAGGFVLGMMNN